MGLKHHIVELKLLLSLPYFCKNGGGGGGWGERRRKEDNFSIVLLYREYQIISLRSCLKSHLCSHPVRFHLGSHLAQFSSSFFAVPRGERTDKKDSQSFLGYLTSTKLNAPSYLLGPELSKFFWKLGNMCLVVYTANRELLMPTV